MTDTPQSPLGSSWNDLNGGAQAPTAQQQAEMQAELTQRQARDKQAILDAHKIFSSDEGRRLMEYLQAEFCDESCLPTAIFQGLDGVSVAVLMAIRDGENNMIRRLKSMAKKGAKLNEPAS